MAPDSLPTRLRQARGSMTLSEAAERAGVPEARIRDYEEGRRKPYAKTLERLAAAYGRSVADLLGATGARSPVSRVAAAPTAAANGANPAPVPPIVVAPGKEIRLVIEILVRTQADAPAPRREPPVPAPEITQTHDSGTATVIASAPPSQPSLSDPGRPVRRRIPVRRVPKKELLGKDRDPLVEIRRAYREFRERR